jgi:excisionase family DNA binding protein
MLTHSDIEAIADMVAEKVMARISVESLPGQYLSIKEAAVFANVSDKTIRNWLDKGYIDGKQTTGKSNGKWLVIRESIKDWMDME